MSDKEKIYSILKYLGGFLFCNILLWAVMRVIVELDQDKQELINCFVLEYGYIKETFDYQSYLQGYCAPSQICACTPTSEWIILFYLMSLPIFVVYELLRRKIVLEKYSYLCVLGEIVFWSILCYNSQDDITYKGFLAESTYKVVSPLAIILLILHSLPQKVLKIAAVVVGIVYGIFCTIILISVLLNLMHF